MKVAQDGQAQLNDVFVWTTEQVIGLAPDKYHIRTSRGIAIPEKWAQLGQTDQLIWGAFPIKGKPSLDVTINLVDLSLNCSCQSRKYPCNHLLGLLLLYVESTESFTDRTPPAHYLEPVAETGGRRKASRASTASPKKRAADLLRREERRRQNITAGLLELELWLHDMVEHGLAAVQDYPKRYWNDMADRLVDYQVGEIAHQIRAMGLLPGKEVDWHESLLKKSSWLYLLIQGFKRYDTLSLALQMDLRLAVGWMPRIDEAIARGQSDQWETLFDSWIVIGKNSEIRGKQTLRRTWLWGERSNRPALLLDVVSRKGSLAPVHIVGSTIDAELHFAPTTTSLYAQLSTSKNIAANGATANRVPRKQTERFVAGYESVAAAAANYRQAVTNNPWLRYFPVALNNVTIDFMAINGAEGRSGIRDLLTPFNVENDKKNSQVGRNDGIAYLLPLPPNFEHQWHLQSLTHQEPLSIFGEWDGEEFVPMSIWHDSRLIELRVLGGSV